MREPMGLRPPISFWAGGQGGRNSEGSQENKKNNSADIRGVKDQNQEEKRPCVWKKKGLYPGGGGGKQRKSGKNPLRILRYV